MAEEISAAMGTTMEGFFDGVDVVAKAMVIATSAATQTVPAETPIPSTKLVLVDEGTYTKRVSEPTPTFAETLTPQKEATYLAASQTKVASPATPFVISTSDRFAALSQALKDNSSLVVTPSSILHSATRKPDADLSSEGSEDIIDDSNDEPAVKKRIFYSNEEEGDDHEAEAIGMYLLTLLSSPLHPLSLPSPFFSLLYIYICIAF